MISTSLNLNNELLTIISNIAIRYNISKSDVIRKILWISCKNLNFNHYIDYTTKYQNRDSPENWKCFRINFSSLEYNFFFYCRFKFRISISNLLFIGAFLFYDELICDLENENPDSIFKNANSYTPSFSVSFQTSKKYLFLFVKIKKTMEKT